MKIRLESKECKDTEKIASIINSFLDEGDLLLLSGNLGSGKTVFVKGFCQNLIKNFQDPVVSPTFTLIKEYDLEKKIYHIDLYRIENISELEELGIYEFCNKDGITLVEWADKFSDYFKDSTYMNISLIVLEDDKREIVINFSKDFDKDKEENILKALKNY